MNAQVLPLQSFYLNLLVTVCNSEKLTAIQQEFDANIGRLWLVHEGSTVPVAHLAYRFEQDAVNLGIETRDQRSLARTVKYAEGLDGFMEELQKFLTANRLPHKRAA